MVEFDVVPHLQVMTFMSTLYVPRASLDFLKAGGVELRGVIGPYGSGTGYIRPARAATR